MLVFLLACGAGGTDSANTVTGPQDLSGNATLEDLAALQEQVDQQAAELDELRGELEAVVAPVTESVDCENSSAGGTAYIRVNGLVTPLSAHVCYTAEGGVLCSSVAMDIAYPDSTTPYEGTTTLVTEFSEHCWSGIDAYAMFSYLPEATD